MTAASSAWVVVGPSPVLVPDAGGGPLSDEVGERHVQGVGDEQQVVDECPVRALLDPVDRLAVEAGEFAELLLREPVDGAGGADVVSDGLPAGDDRCGQGFGWHAYTLVGGVIVVCTIVGTFASADSGQYARPSRLKRSFE